MSYLDLGARSAAATADTTGFNRGNWTIQFTPQIINVTQNHFELYKIVVTGSANTATFNVYRDTYLWDTAVYGTNNSWDPQQPLHLNPGNTIFFYYTSASSDGHQPLATIWLRYDPALPGVYGL